MSAETRRTREASSDEQELLTEVLSKADVHIEEPRSPEEMPSGGAVIAADGEDADELRELLNQEDQSGVPDAAQSQSSITEKLQQKAEDRAAVEEAVRNAEDESEALEILIEAVAEGTVDTAEAKELLDSLAFDEDDSQESNAPQELAGSDTSRGELAKAEQKTSTERRPGELTELQKSLMKGMPKSAKTNVRLENRRRREERESEEGSDHFEDTLHKSGDGQTVSESLGIPTDEDRDAEPDGETTLGDVIRAF